MKPFSILAWLVGVFVGVYVLYSFWQAEKAPTTVDLSTPNSFKSIPGTKCSLGNDDGTATGTLYVFHDAARFDIYSITSGAPITTHIIVSRDDSAFFWQEGATAGRKQDYVGFFNAMRLGVLSHVECRPWWIPAGDLFVVPANVSIK